MPEWTNLLSGVLENIVNIIPYDIIHEYQLGVYFKRGKMSDVQLTHENGAPHLFARFNPFNYSLVDPNNLKPAKPFRVIGDLKNGVMAEDEDD